MTSSKAKARRLEEGRLKRARALAGIDTRCAAGSLPPGAVPADHAALKHNNTYGPLPRFYVDKIVVCRNCGKEEVWPAERQKWWSEVARGNINTEAVLCRSCRAAKKAKRAEARHIHLDGLARKRVRKR